MLNGVDEETRQLIHERIAPLSGQFPNWHADELTVEGYVIVLADLDPLMLESAIFHLMSQRREFMPTAGTIRHAAFDLAQGNGGPPDPFEAWEQVNQALLNGAGHPIVGEGMTPAVHPLVEKAVRYIGGWRYLSASDNPVADRAHFVKAYKQTVDREVEDLRMLPQVRERIKALADSLANQKQLTQEERSDD